MARAKDRELDRAIDGMKAALLVLDDLRLDQAAIHLQYAIDIVTGVGPVRDIDVMDKLLQEAEAQRILSKM